MSAEDRGGRSRPNSISIDFEAFQHAKRMDRKKMDITLPLLQLVDYRQPIWERLYIATNLYLLVERLG